ncbi:MAG: CTP-dependent riboflavin kinase [Promethearchaeota archaeon]|nr:MAG: CTP-dependent riboflavin kinase [Candidatus Lokiarchaeota archaeon]
MSNNSSFSPENYANWFALYFLCQNIGDKRAIYLSSGEFGEILGVSQQTASRRIQSLEELGWIERKIEGKTQSIRITPQGADILLTIFKNLKTVLENVLIVGKVTEGMKEGGFYVSIKGYYEQFKDKLGFTPYKGTLNLEMSDLNKTLLRENLNNKVPIVINGFRDENSGRTYGNVHCYHCFISRLEDRKNKIKAAILDIERTHHKKNVVEILAEPYLRETFNLKDGNKVIIELIKNQK